MKALTSIIILIFISFSALQSQSAKQLYGNVFNEKGESLIGATVQWMDTETGTVTDEKGDFWIQKMGQPAYLVIQFVGYEPMQVEMFPEEDSVFIKIEGITELETVVVAEHRGDAFTSTLDPLNIEQITSCELKKAACCNLAESFETSGSVDVMRQDAVTSATEIQMLGLRGIYSQLLVEKRPAFTGLGSPLALEYIPGTWVGGIQVSKGASTVQNGPQAITGQINTELVKPFNDKPLFINLFGSTTERGEVNVHLNKKWTEQLSSGLLLHGSTAQGEFDRNGDGFIDQPKKTTLDALWRNYYVTEKFSTQFNVQVLSDERESGQVAAFQNKPDPQFPTYKIDQQNRRVDVFGKFGYIGFAKPETSMGFIYSGSFHDMKNTFGNTRYNGQQVNFYTNLIYATFLGTTDHKLNVGGSFQYDDYEEFLNEADFSRRETMPGAFAEYGHTAGKFGLMAGLRIDHHNRYGTFVTPRANLKYNFNDNTILRMSGGRGVRTAQILSENIAVMASNRQFVVDQSALDIEDAWNAGLNFTKNFRLGGKSASLVADFYHTEFVNQVVMDVESEHGKVLFYNLDGRSYSNSLLVLGTWAPLRGFDMKLVYKLNDVKVTYNGTGDPVQRPMMARHRGLVTLNYETPDKKWMFNSYTQLISKQRFAHAHGVPSELVENFTGEAPAYAVLNAQVTRRFKNLEVYVGGENLTDYRQQNAIVDWQNPFGEYFDAMQVWGPLVGARAYVGLRMWLDAK
ncbi:MAG: TonB-dependent receptor [Bacteroidetes bacterium]|nr:TonB-dependent receptor [Bacteroidota bacterium]